MFVCRTVTRPDLTRLRRVLQVKITIEQWRHLHLHCTFCDSASGECGPCVVLSSVSGSSRPLPSRKYLPFDLTILKIPAQVYLPPAAGLARATMPSTEPFT